ncbi:hypothetical protein Q4595_07605 [Wenyingzhuangia sp. 1_MG-2023]|nr:hypothetical protein [Wenyingzhuangia sp. 1_MG-2023]
MQILKKVLAVLDKKTAQMINKYNKPLKNDSTYTRPKQQKA